VALVLAADRDEHDVALGRRQRWGLGVAERRGGGRWRLAYGLPAAAFWVALIGMAVSTVLLVHTWRTSMSSGRADRATVLAEGIAVTMNLTAVFSGLAGLLYVAAGVMAAIGTLGRRRSRTWSGSGDDDAEIRSGDGA
jgi:hypothetical protein